MRARAAAPGARDPGAADLTQALEAGHDLTSLDRLADSAATSSTIRRRSAWRVLPQRTVSRRRQLPVASWIFAGLNEADRRKFCRVPFGETVSRAESLERHKAWRAANGCAADQDCRGAWRKILAACSGNQGEADRRMDLAHAIPQRSRHALPSVAPSRDRLVPRPAPVQALVTWMHKSRREWLATLNAKQYATLIGSRPTREIGARVETLKLEPQTPRRRTDPLDVASLAGAPEVRFAPRPRAPARHAPTPRRAPITIDVTPEPAWHAPDLVPLELVALFERNRLAPIWGRA